MVPSEVIDEIRERVDLLRIVSEVVPLKKTGRNYTGLCPFHSEKSPSFTVNEQKQLYHCFGCGEGGTVFTFFMKYYRLTFPETIERLAEMAGVDIRAYDSGPSSYKAQNERKQKFISLLRYARDVYHHIFLHSEQAKEAREYIASRGLTDETIRRIKIGFSPDAWDTLSNTFKKENLSLEEASQVGLLAKRKEGGFYDVFRSRILFPITNPQGEPIGFGGRILQTGEPKYLNSAQTILFDKGSVLFGLHEASPAINREKRIIIVEGYFDQVSLFQQGFENCVATLGTALTESHAKLLRKYSDEMILMFDGDDAGRKAVARSLKPLLTQGLNARVVFLPSHLDPDEYVKKFGKRSLHEHIQQAVPLLHFYVEEFYKKAKDVSEKAKVVEEFSHIVKEARDIYLQEAIIDEICQLTRMERSFFQGEAKIRASKTVFSSPPTKAPKSFSPGSPISLEELELLRLSVEVSQVREFLMKEENVSLFSSSQLASTARTWLQQLASFSSSDQKTSAMVDAWEDTESRSLLAKVFMESSIDYSTMWKQVFKDCIRKLRSREISRLTQEVAVAEQGGKSEEVEELSRRVQELKSSDMHLDELEKWLGIQERTA